MSSLYEMTVRIEEYKARNLPKIVRACRKEWGFAPGDFIRERTDPLKRRCDKVSATAQGSLCYGEGDDDFADRLVRGIWRANGGYCHVEVHAAYLENPPCETYTFDEGDFEESMRAQAAAAAAKPKPEDYRCFGTIQPEHSECKECPLRRRCVTKAGAR